jgi:hypothetical protein
MNDFFVYIERLELIAFFTGIPLLGIVIFLVIGKRKMGITLLHTIIPLTYATLSVLYFAMKIYQHGLDIGNWLVQGTLLHNLLKGWAISAILFFIPAFRKRWKGLSHYHGLVFYGILLNDLIQTNWQALSAELIRNEWLLQALSTLGTLLMLAVLYFLLPARYSRLE